MDASVPLILDPIEPSIPDDGRLWIGNLDPRVTETGQLAGQPRGFAFVTYRKREDAMKAQEQLHGKLVGCRNLSVKWAKNTSNEDIEKPKPQLGIAALSVSASKSEFKLSKKTAIQSIEAKLKSMESKEAGDDFVINKLAAKETPVLTHFQTKYNQPIKKETSNSWKRRHPYHRKR